MYGDGGPPGHQGKPPIDVCAFRSLASAASRSALAIARVEHVDQVRAGVLAALRRRSSHGVSSSAILRLGSAASQVSSGVSRFESSCAIFATAG